MPGICFKLASYVSSYMLQDTFCICIGNGSTTTNLQQPCKHIIDNDATPSQIVTGFMKPVYPVLVGNSVKVCSTNLFASLPQHDKFLVKERLRDPVAGFTRAKLVLKSSITEVKENLRYKLYVTIDCVVVV